MDAILAAFGRLYVKHLYKTSESSASAETASPAIPAIVVTPKDKYAFLSGNTERSTVMKLILVVLGRFFHGTSQYLAHATTEMLKAVTAPGADVNAGKAEEKIQAFYNAFRERVALIAQLTLAPELRAEFSKMTTREEKEAFLEQHKCLAQAYGEDANEAVVRLIGSHLDAGVAGKLYSKSFIAKQLAGQSPTVISTAQNEVNQKLEAIQTRVLDKIAEVEAKRFVQVYNSNVINSKTTDLPKENTLKETINRKNQELIALSGNKSANYENILKQGIFEGFKGIISEKETLTVNPALVQAGIESFVETLTEELKELEAKLASDEEALAKFNGSSKEEFESIAIRATALRKAHDEATAELKAKGEELSLLVGAEWGDSLSEYTYYKNQMTIQLAEVQNKEREKRISKVCPKGNVDEYRAAVKIKVLPEEPIVFNTVKEFLEDVKAFLVGIEATTAREQIVELIELLTEENEIKGDEIKPEESISSEVFCKKLSEFSKKVSSNSQLEMDVQRCLSKLEKFIKNDLKQVFVKRNLAEAGLAKLKTLKEGLQIKNIGKVKELNTVIEEQKEKVKVKKDEIEKQAKVQSNQKLLDGLPALKQNLKELENKIMANELNPMGENREAYLHNLRMLNEKKKEIIGLNAALSNMTIFTSTATEQETKSKIEAAKTAKETLAEQINAMEKKVKDELKQLNEGVEKLKGEIKGIEALPSPLTEMEERFDAEKEAARLLREFLTLPAKVE